MVRAMHQAGIEVILDVVYNHTPEGPPDGPMLSFRGIDNFFYYRTASGDPSRYADYTGCGNTFDTRGPFQLQLVMDSLRYWISEMHVDGFRFDLASALARAAPDVDKQSPFLDTIHQDPLISQVETHRRAVGRRRRRLSGRPVPAPVDGVEWPLSRHRAQLLVRRRQWRARPRVPAVGIIGPLCRRWPFAVRIDQLHHRARRLHDARPGRLTTTSTTRTTARTTATAPTTTGPTTSASKARPTDPSIIALRQRQVRNLLTTLVLSAGVPMVVAGDERWRTTNGNNNPYAQDNPTSWLDWTGGPEADSFLALVRSLIALRRRSPVLRQRAFFDGRPVPGGDGCKDLAWFHPDGRELADADWFDGGLRTMGMYLDGRGLRDRRPTRPDHHRRVVPVHRAQRR